MFITPTSDKPASEDTLFHYTTAAGLHGIISSNTIWSTAYHCSNDSSEFRSGIGILSDAVMNRLENPPNIDGGRMDKNFLKRQEIYERAYSFERWVFNTIVSNWDLYITSFCSHHENANNFQNGALGQWRGYGPDGGYAIAFNKNKLERLVSQANQIISGEYELGEVHYSEEMIGLLGQIPGRVSREQRLKDGTQYLVDLFIDEYSQNQSDLAQTSTNQQTSAKGLFIRDFDSENTGIKSYLNYLKFRKNLNFKEEMEFRLALVSPKNQDAQKHRLMPQFFNRSGMLVPYVEFPRDLKISECIDAIIVGPAERMSDRYQSTKSFLHRHAINASVRTSEIPFIRGNE